jgi:hypothetical protein
MKSLFNRDLRDLVVFFDFIALGTSKYVIYHSSATRKDKLPAISGIANQIQPMRKTGYLAGLWQDTLLHDLLWTTFPTSQGKSRANPWRAPSWSWASIDNAICYDFRYQFRSKLRLETKLALDFTVKILEANCELAGPDPVGEVTSGFIRLYGSVVQVSLKRDIQENKWAPDNNIFYNGGPLGLFYPNGTGCMEGTGIYCLKMAEIPKLQENGRYIFMVMQVVNMDEQIYERIGLLLIEREDHSANHIEDLMGNLLPREITIV